MDRSTGDCLVTGYEGLIPALELPDPDDRHVLAAAIAGRCDVIVTQNLKDFPDIAPEPWAVSGDPDRQWADRYCRRASAFRRTAITSCAGRRKPIPR